ncbi:MAG: hypothetical protein H6895_02865 [Defluviimonas sp.]|uniref:hypothetical protein n=1 Tax=Albidovulum sp. TaxID=1872424 RepID=UPI001DA20834|nr:hypothetical protein [Paracoccaceae bacterium]MCC0063015.1 hypothetical protein [Defluviimonas sp.]
MQLIVQFDTTGFDAWKADYDAHAETRDNAGLTMLQMWRDADDGNRVAVLYEVHDRARADQWFRQQAALKGATSAQFLKTA